MKTISNRLTIETHSGKQIICVDCSGLKSKDMVELKSRHLELTLERKLPFLCDLRNTYLSREYLETSREFVELTKHVINKGALLGIDKIKAQILQGIRLDYGVDYQAFDTREEAIQFLLDTPA